MFSCWDGTKYGHVWLSRAQIHSNVRSRWDAGETEVGHRRLGRLPRRFEDWVKCKGQQQLISQILLEMCWCCNASWQIFYKLQDCQNERPNLSNIYSLPGGCHWWFSLPGAQVVTAMRNFGDLAVKAGLHDLDKSWETVIIWVTYIPKLISFQVFLLFCRKISWSRFFFQNPSHKILSSGSCCNRDAGSHCIGRSHGSKFQPSKDTNTQLGASHVRLHESWRH